MLCWHMGYPPPLMVYSVQLKAVWKLELRCIHTATKQCDQMRRNKIDIVI